MIEKSERDYDDLTAKKATVARDRSKIEAVISELEVKKQETLEATWQKVNRDFGSIFSSLLPGAHAKLEPPEGATSVLDGLEVKVGFGGLWKESRAVWKSNLTPSTRRRLDGAPDSLVDSRTGRCPNCPAASGR